MKKGKLFLIPKKGTTLEDFFSGNSFSNLHKGTIWAQ